MHDDNKSAFYLEINHNFYTVLPVFLLPMSVQIKNSCVRTTTISASPVALKSAIHMGYLPQSFLLNPNAREGKRPKRGTYLLPVAKDEALQATAFRQFLVSPLLRKVSSSGKKRQKVQTISYNHPKRLLDPRC